MKKTAVSRKLLGFTVATAIAISATTATAYAYDVSAGEPEPQSVGLLLPAIQKVREATDRGSTSAVLDVSSEGESTEGKTGFGDVILSTEGQSTEGRIVFTPVVVTS